MGEQIFLQELGQKLRSARQRAGLSVSELARRAGLSRRYVTAAESGQANPSVLKLAALAEALGMPLAELCDLKLRGYGGQRIALVGLRGAGKSTLGRALALELDAPFVELDARVERLAGMSLGEIFDLHGSDYFHQLEGEALEEVLAEGDRLVLAAGGSIVDSAVNFARLRAVCHTVWLEAEPEDHFRRVISQGDRRPMRDRPRAMEELRGLLERRRGSYGQCDLRVSTSGRGVESCLRELVSQAEGSWRA